MRETQDSRVPSDFPKTIQLIVAYTEFEPMSLDRIQIIVISTMSKLFNFQ